MNKKTVAIFVACMLLVCFASVYITLAYLTDDTDVVTNTFTSGNVDITLTETKIDTDGVTAMEGVTVGAGETNKYKLIPNQEYVKDPTITVAETSEDSYIGAVITIKNANSLPADITKTLEGTFGITLKSGWEVTNSNTTGNDWTFAVVYKTGAVTAESVNVIFDKITAPDLDNTELQTATATGTGVSIEVHAYAVQAAGFEAAAEGHPTEADLAQHALATAFDGVFSHVA